MAAKILCDVYIFKYLQKMYLLQNWGEWVISACPGMTKSTWCPLVVIRIVFLNFFHIYNVFVCVRVCQRANEQVQTTFSVTWHYTVIWYVYVKVFFYCQAQYDVIYVSKCLACVDWLSLISSAQQENNVAVVGWMCLDFRTSTNSLFKPFRWRRVLDDFLNLFSFSSVFLSEFCRCF